MNVFKEKNYRAAITSRVLALKKQNSKMNFQALANHCGVKKTYLSRVLRGGKFHMNADQLFLTLEFLGFSNDEREFLELLYEWERTELSARKLKLKIRLEQIEKRGEKLEGRNTPQPTDENAEYYLNANAQLTHLFLEIEALAKRPALIASILNVSLAEFTDILKMLTQLGFIEQGKEAIRVVCSHLPLAEDSLLQKPHQILMRLKSLERTQRLDKNRAYTYSGLYAATAKEKAWIRKEFADFLNRVEDTVKKAKSEEVFQINFDFFDWSAS